MNKSDEHDKKKAKQLLSILWFPLLKRNKKQKSLVSLKIDIQWFHLHHQLKVFPCDVILLIWLSSKTISRIIFALDLDTYWNGIPTQHFRIEAGNCVKHETGNSSKQARQANKYHTHKKSFTIQKSVWERHRTPKKKPIEKPYTLLQSKNVWHMALKDRVLGVLQNKNIDARTTISHLYE